MIQGTKTSPDKDMLIVEEGPMIRSRAKRVKENDGIVCSSKDGRNIDPGEQRNKFRIGLGRRNTMNQLNSSSERGRQTV